MEIKNTRSRGEFILVPSFSSCYVLVKCVMKYIERTIERTSKLYSYLDNLVKCLFTICAMWSVSLSLSFSKAVLVGKFSATE